MRVCLISYHPVTSAGDAARLDELQTLRHYAAALVQHGLQVSWVCSTDTVEALADDAGLVAMGEDGLPRTCRYVIPCKAYGLEGIQLFCADRSLWQERSLHTRLFTFLCLLQRELPGAVWHALGVFPAPYIAVYTARFLSLPAVVSYSRASLRDQPQHVFEWQWVAQHTSLALVANTADQQRLLETRGVQPARVQVMPPTRSQAVSILIMRYRSLQGAVTRESA